MADQLKFQPIIVDGVPEITPETLHSCAGKVTLIDVRGEDEYYGELSHIAGAKLVTLGPDLEDFLNSHDKTDEVVFICRSGARSGRATLYSQTLGFKNCVNLQGGMILWNAKKLPVEK